MPTGHTTKPDTLSGKLLPGGYRLEQALGQGGMGEVYEALHKPLGRRVAVKVLHPHLASDPVLLERFRREAEAAAGLGHPNIVQVTDFFHEPDEPVFMVLEYLSGCSLKECLDREQRLSPTRSAFISSQVLSALEAAHAAGIVHRDLKPANIFLIEISGVRDIVKVLDFGIAKLTGDATVTQVTRTGAVLGTPAYMAPEQARGQEVDHRTDIYAMGATLYRMLSGNDPFSAPNFNAMMFAITDHEPLPIPQLCPDVPSGLVELVERAMAKDPAARFQSAAEMRAALQPFSRTSLPPQEIELLAGLTPVTDPGAGEPSDTVRDRGALPPPETVEDPPEADVEAPEPDAALTARVSPKDRARGGMWLIGIAGLAFVAGLTVLVVMHYSGRRPSSGQAPPPAQAAPRPAPAASVTAPPDAAAPAPDATPPDARPAKKETRRPAARTRPRPIAKKKPRRPVRLTAYYAGCNANGLYTANQLRALLTAVQGRVGACFSARALEHPRGRYVDWDLGLSPEGRVLGGRRVGLYQPPKEPSQCVFRVLEAINFGPTRTGAGGRIKVHFKLVQVKKKD